MEIPTRILLWCRLSLCFMWLFTAATSFWWARDVGYAILQTHAITVIWADMLINAGSLVDALVGLWLLSNWQRLWCYRFQLAVICVYSLLLSLLAPSVWLNPFGPLTKNFPIIALIILLYSIEKNRVQK